MHRSGAISFSVNARLLGGWVLLLVFGGSALAINLYLMKNDPSLFARKGYAGRITDRETSQKIIQTITSIGFIAMLVVPALWVKDFGVLFVLCRPQTRRSRS